MNGLSGDEVAELGAAAWAKFLAMPSSNPGDIARALIPAVERIVAAREAEACTSVLSLMADAFPDDCACGGCARCTLHDVWLPRMHDVLAATDPARQLAADPKEQVRE